MTPEIEGGLRFMARLVIAIIIIIGGAALAALALWGNP